MSRVGDHFFDAAWLSRNRGRKAVMCYSGVAFMIAAIILAAA